MTNDAASAVTGTLADLGVDPSGIDVDDVTEGELRHLQKQEHLKKTKSFLQRKWGGVIGDQVHLHITGLLTYSPTHSLTGLLTYSLAYSLTHHWLTHLLTLTHSLLLTHWLTYSLTHLLTHSLLLTHLFLPLTPSYSLA